MAVRILGLVATLVLSVALAAFLAWRFGLVWALVAAPLFLLAIGLAVQATGALSRAEEDE